MNANALAAAGLAVLMAVLVLGTSGCATDDGSSDPNMRADGRSQAAASRDDDAPPDLDEVAAEMSRSLLGSQRVQGARGGSAAVVSVERFVNHTRASEKDFASFRRDFVKGLRDSGRAWGLLFEPAEASRAGRYELHAAVMPIGESEDDQWLVRMLVVGPGASGSRQTLWSDTLLTRAR
ncbi:MAG: hypothetical protein ACOC1G_03615 [Phycisphaeraceae bacterium]